MGGVVQKAEELVGEVAELYSKFSKLFTEVEIVSSTENPLRFPVAPLDIFVAMAYQETKNINSFHILYPRGKEKKRTLLQRVSKATEYVHLPMTSKVRSFFSEILRNELFFKENLNSTSLLQYDDFLEEHPSPYCQGCYPQKYIVEFFLEATATVPVLEESVSEEINNMLTGDNNYL
jgi:hypothetical protein